MPHVESILVRDRNTGDERVVNTDAVFIAVGTTPRSNVLKAAGVALNEAGYAIAARAERPMCQACSLRAMCAKNRCAK